MAHWKKGRGKLGIFNPLLGQWECAASSPMGEVIVRRTTRKILTGKYIETKVHWKFAKSEYEERALFGVGKDAHVECWSFTSDGKQSHGVIADARDRHEQALGFEFQMPAGLARQVYSPCENGFNWIVESKTKKGWNRFVSHQYFKSV
jgi:hypothetical protein